MPRDSSGNYTLPLGNPVIDGTVIDVNWANPTMADIAVQLNNVLTRDGLLSPTDAFYVTDGTPALPGLAFSSGHGSGLWKDTTQIGISYAGVAKQVWGAAGTTVQGNLGMTGFLNLVNGQSVNWGDGSVAIGGDAVADYLAFFTAVQERMRIDATGNVGVGTTPAAWWSSRRVLSLATIPSGPHASFVASTDGTTEIWSNLYLDQSAATTRYTTTGFGNVYQQNVAGAGAFAWLTAPSGTADTVATTVERMRIGPAGHVFINGVAGLGITGNAFLQVAGQILAYGDNFGFRALNSAANGEISMSPLPGAGAGGQLASGAGPLLFSTSGLERMRIDAAGRVRVGGQPEISTDNFFEIHAPTAFPLCLRNLNAPAIFWRVGPDTSGAFLVYNQAAAGVHLPNGGTAWVASSDERYKTDFVPFADAAAKVATLRAGTGRYLSDGPDVSRSFLIAQDVQAVLPEAVTEGRDDQLGIAYSDVIPLLVAAIKELNSRLAAGGL